MKMDRRNRGTSVGLVLLVSELMGVGIGNIPPVTLCVILAQAVIYLRLIDIPWRVMDICISSEYVWHGRQWKRLFLASFDHSDDMHLYFNMVSFLWKGLHLERKYGSRKFAVIVAAFSVLCNVVYVALGELAVSVFHDASYRYQCAIGFSAVIFALKVLWTRHQSSHNTGNVFGFSVPLNWAYWLELVAIQILVPNASFIGHLAGILVGLAYTQGPLKPILKVIWKSL